MVCPRANIKLEEKPIIADTCEQCFGCVHHCITHVLKTNMDKVVKDILIHIYPYHK